MASQKRCHRSETVEGKRGNWTPRSQLSTLFEFDSKYGALFFRWTGAPRSLIKWGRFLIAVLSAAGILLLWRFVSNSGFIPGKCVCRQLARELRGGVGFWLTHLPTFFFSVARIVSYKWYLGEKSFQGISRQMGFTRWNPLLSSFGIFWLFEFERKWV